MSIDSVEVRGLGKRYGLHRALHAVDLDLQAGGVCALLGPNGAGKSTLLGVLSSIVRPSAGTVRYLADGKPIKAGESLRRQIGVVAHDSFLYSGLTALENLNFWGQLYNVDNLEEHSRELLRTVGLEEKAWEHRWNLFARHGAKALCGSHDASRPFGTTP